MRRARKRQAVTAPLITERGRRCLSSCLGTRDGGVLWWICCGKGIQSGTLSSTQRWQVIAAATANSATRASLPQGLMALGPGR